MNAPAKVAGQEKGEHWPRFSCLTSQLSALLVTLGKAVDSRSTIPLLNHVLVESAAGKVSFTSTNLDVFIKMDLPAHSQSGEFRTLLPWQEFTAAVGSLHGVASTITFRPTHTTAGGHETATITDGHSTCTFTTLHADDWPEESRTFHELTDSMAVKKHSLDRLVGMVGPYISTEETRYYLGGICLHWRQDQGQPGWFAVATDGHRLIFTPLAAVTADAPKALSRNQTILPRVALPAVKACLARHAKHDELTLKVGDCHLRLEGDGWCLMSKAIDGTFPDYDRAIPKDRNSHAILNRQALYQAAVDAISFNGDKIPTVRVEAGAAQGIEDGNIRVSARNVEAMGEWSVCLPFRGDWQGSTGFNAEYLAAVLKGIEGDGVRLGFYEDCVIKTDEKGNPTAFKGNSAPVIFSGKLDSAIRVLMPMRV